MNSTNYKQYDTRWSGLVYPKKPYYIKNCGCGEVAICNLIIEMANYSSQTPKTIQPYCVQYAAPSGDGTYWSGIPAMMKHYGMTEVKEHATMPALFSELAKGNRVAILLMGSKPGGSKGIRWSSGGHFIAATGYKKSGSHDMLYIKDSNSSTSNRNGWLSYQESLKGDCLKVWSGKLNGALYTEPKVDSGKLTVDGKGGKATVKRMQEFFGTTKDGVITGQKEANKKYYKSLTSVKFGKGGSACVKKLQKWVGTSQDGVLGPNTVKAWQKKIGVTADGYFGTNSMKAWQKYLNEHDKPVYPDPTPTQTPQDKMCAWARKMAADNTWHYVKWNSKDSKTKECPICHNHPKGKYHGGNCIWFCFASWRHGAGIKCNCSCSVINNDEAKQILTASTDAKALALAKKLIGIKDIKVLRNKNGLSQSQLKAGDICIQFSGTTAKHFWLYLGNGQMADCRGSNGKVPNNDQISVRKASSCKVAIRYTGK